VGGDRLRLLDYSPDNAKTQKNLWASSTMTDTVFNTGGDESALPLSGARLMAHWLESPQAQNPIDELPALRAHLDSLSELTFTPQQRASALDGLYKRGFLVIAGILPSLTNSMLPVERKSRRVVRSVLDLLQGLADQTSALVSLFNSENLNDTRHAPELALWRSLHALAYQLMISNVIASPAPTGVWRQLHQTYQYAQRLDLHGRVPHGASSSLQHIYHAAVLLGCSQPASLTPREVLFLAAYFERFADQIQIGEMKPVVAADSFWVDPDRDIAAFSCLRKPLIVAGEIAPIFFSCERISKLLKAQLTELEAGTPPLHINLPDFAATSAGLGVLRRLAGRWGDSGKRRYNRRRQNQRTVLATGIDGLWSLYKAGEGAEVELSSWMITNESPDGYAVMHVTGKTGKLSVGDVVAVRSGTTGDWQICLARWAVSENPEHLELGLQILAPKAIPAILAQTKGAKGAEYLRVLVLPELQKIRSQKLLVVAAGAIPKKKKKLLLVVDGKNIAIHEVFVTAVDEQTGSVEILSISPDESSC
jgi:hypothetical protein